MSIPCALLKRTNGISNSQEKAEKEAAAREAKTMTKEVQCYKQDRNPANIKKFDYKFNPFCVHFKNL